MFTELTCQTESDILNQNFISNLLCVKIKYWLISVCQKTFN
jgi:hypothetical protein